MLCIHPYIFEVYFKIKMKDTWRVIVGLLEDKIEGQTYNIIYTYYTEIYMYVTKRFC